MSTLLIDTSALHALNYARDNNHTQALTYFKSLAGRVKPILTEWVFVETMNLTKARLGPAHAIAFGRQLKTSKTFYPLILTDIDKRTPGTSLPSTRTNSGATLTVRCWPWLGG